MRTTQPDRDGTRTVSGGASGSGGQGPGYTLTRTGVGTYTLRFTQPTKALLALAPTISQSTGYWAVWVANADGSATIQVTNGSAGADANVSFIATLLSR